MFPLIMQADLAMFCENCISILEHVTMPTGETHNHNFLGRIPTTKFNGSTLMVSMDLYILLWCVHFHGIDSER